MAVKEIKDLDGRTLFRAEAATIKELVRKAASERASLRRADLARADLNGLDLAGVDLSDANLYRARFKGANLAGADLSGVSAAHAQFFGAHLARVRFDGANLVHAVFDGATAGQASFRGAVLDDAGFPQASLTGADFSQAEACKASFRGARLVNAKFCYGRFVACDFAQADLGVSGKLDALHLPDRTRGAVAIGCDYDDAKLPKRSLPAMRWDRWTGRGAEGLLSCVAAGSAAFGGYMLLPHWMEVGGLVEVAEKGAGAVGGLALVVMTAKRIEEFLSEKIAEAAVRLQVRVRDSVSRLVRVGADRAWLTVAMVKQGSDVPLRRALAATAPEAASRGFFARWTEFSAKVGRVVVCDRRHLGLALDECAFERDRRHPVDRDVVLVRTGDGEGSPSLPCGDASGSAATPVPVAVRLSRDGTRSAVWAGEDGKPRIVATYGEDGAPVEAWNIAKREPVDPAGIGRLPAWKATLDAFEAGVRRDCGLPAAVRPTETHAVAVGADGTVLVYDRRSGRLDNPLGPSVVKPTGEEVWFRQGRQTATRRHGGPGGPEAEAAALGM